MKKILIPFALLYFPLTTLVGLLWLQVDGASSLMAFAIWQLIMAKVLYDIVWLTGALVFSPMDLPRLTELEMYPPVALLYTCRDDIVPGCMRQLILQSYPNYDVFILDDSQTGDQKSAVDQISAELRSKSARNPKVEVIRRARLTGYKAGNLNHWLQSYGDEYDYFIILDNDSKAKRNFIENLVRYAEHPANRNVAIFQSEVTPWNTGNYFVRFIGATAPYLMRVLGSVGNRTGTIISFGHNNLHRTQAIQEIGGFHQELTSEDTVATYELDAIGYKTSLVKVSSYEAEPADILKYRRRAIRWAGQTAALFRHPWKDTSGALKFELSRQLIYYLVNLVFLGWILGSVWYGKDESTLAEIYQQAVSLITEYETPFVLTFLLVISVMGIHFLVHSVNAHRGGVRILDYLGHLIASLAVYFFTVVPVSIALIKGLTGSNVKFEPSNKLSNPISLGNLTTQMLLLWGISLLAILQHLLLGKNPWAYLGGWWATMICITPAILYLFHKFPRRA